MLAETAQSVGERAVRDSKGVSRSLYSVSRSLIVLVGLFVVLVVKSV